MRARSIKPGFYKNEDLAECSIEARLLFPGLWMLADCMGRLENRPKRIKGELFPFDNIDVSPLLEELSQWGLIRFYEANGGKYIWITNFLKHQRPHQNESTSAIPCHPEDPYFEKEERSRAIKCHQGANNEQPKRESLCTKVESALHQGEKHFALNPSSLNPDKNIVSSVPEEDGECVFDVSEKTEDQPEEEKPKRNNYPADFNTFFQAFPHKEGVSKKKAFEAWKRARDKPDLQSMLAIIEILKRSEQWQRGFIPHASTWLNGKCWETVGDKPTVIHNHFEEISGDLPVWMDT